MTTAVPTKVLWGIQWEIFVMPAEYDTERPRPPEYPGEEATPEQIDAYNEAAAAFAQADAAFEAEMTTLAGDAANWFKTVTVADDENSAREMLPVLRQANEGNPFNRDFQLVTQARPRWTVVPVEEE